MSKYRTPVMVIAILALMILIPFRSTTYSAGKAKEFERPLVFQAAGPTALSIDATINAFRDELGGVNNLNNAGPLGSGRREINWDGGGADTTTAPVTPFNTFLNTRGNQTTTPGTGLSQAPPAGGTNGGLAALFNNATYGVTFRAFSLSRVFTPVGSNVTDSFFFIPGSNGDTPAIVRGFGVIFSDIDLPNGTGPAPKHGNRKGSTRITCYDENGDLIFSSIAPASPGDGNFSFFGVVFETARIARVRIITGNAPLGPNDGDKTDVVVMDDFIYGEPQLIP